MCRKIALTSHIPNKPDLARSPNALQKYTPLDLRVKKTRAIRKALTKHQVRCSP